MPPFRDWKYCICGDVKSPLRSPNPISPQAVRAEGPTQHSPGQRPISVNFTALVGYWEQKGRAAGKFKQLQLASEARPRRAP
jgi:hypothetical protein